MGSRETGAVVCVTCSVMHTQSAAGALAELPVDLEAQAAGDCVEA